MNKRKQKLISRLNRDVNKARHRVFFNAQIYSISKYEKLLRRDGRKYGLNLSNHTIRKMAHSLYDAQFVNLWPKPDFRIETETPPFRVSGYNFGGVNIRHPGVTINVGPV